MTQPSQQDRWSSCALLDVPLIAAGTLRDAVCCVEPKRDFGKEKEFRPPNTIRLYAPGFSPSPHAAYEAQPPAWTSSPGQFAACQVADGFSPSLLRQQQRVSSPPSYYPSFPFGNYGHYYPPSPPPPPPSYSSPPPLSARIYTYEMQQQQQQAPGGIEPAWHWPVGSAVAVAPSAEFGLRTVATLPENTPRDNSFANGRGEGAGGGLDAAATTNDTPAAAGAGAAAFAGGGGPAGRRGEGEEGSRWCAAEGWSSLPFQEGGEAEKKERNSEGKGEVKKTGYADADSPMVGEKEEDKEEEEEEEGGEEEGEEEEEDGERKGVSGEACPQKQSKRNEKEKKKTEDKKNEEEERLSVSSVSSSQHDCRMKKAEKEELSKEEEIGQGGKEEERKEKEKTFLLQQQKKETLNDLFEEGEVADEMASTKGESLKFSSEIPLFAKGSNKEIPICSGATASTFSGFDFTNTPRFSKLKGGLDGGDEWSSNKQQYEGHWPIGYVPPADRKYKKIVVGDQVYWEGGTFYLSETGAYLLGLRG
ncbi:hypothetical protein Efla_005690 [Eimeria flavescens]